MALNGLIAANNLSDVVDIERTWDNIGNNISATVSVPSPTLDLNFAANKSLVDDISGNNLITFSRASTGTFVGSNGLIQTAASGVPRFDHNPATGESLGLVVEEARTNLMTYSEQFDDAAWVKTNLTVTANQAVAPDGTNTADLLSTSTTGATVYWIRQDAGSTPSTSSSTIYVKYISQRYVKLRYGGSTFHALFDLVTGTKIAESGGITGSITLLGNGWLKISATTLSANNRFDFRFSDASGADSPDIGASATSIYIWGAQAEAGAFPTSYIPTTTATVTRAADIAGITGTNFSSWYNPSEGTVVASASINTSGYLINFYGASSTQNRISLLRNSSGRGQLVVETSAVVQAAISLSGGDSVAIPSRLAGAYKTDNFYIAQGSSFTGSDTSGTPDASIYRAAIGSPASSSFANGTIARLTYYPVRLSNITLQALTTYGPVSSFPYSFSIKGRDILALKEVNKTSTRDFVFIKGLSSKAQPRINIASQYTASGVALRNAAMLKVAPTTAGNYFFSSGLTLSGTTFQINGTNAHSIATSPFSGSTATVPLLFAGLRPQANWRFSEAMTSGTVVSPEFAIPIETSAFLLFIKTGQG